MWCSHHRVNRAVYVAAFQAGVLDRQPHAPRFERQRTEADRARASGGSEATSDNREAIS